MIHLFFTFASILLAMRNSRHSAFTIMELLVVIGIIAILMALLLPMAERVRHRSYINACAANLHTIGQAMTMYANENHGNYPRATYAPALATTNGWTAGTDNALPDEFSPPGPHTPNDVTASLWLLMRSQKLPPSVFVCAYGDVNEFIADSADPLAHANFTDYRKNLGYSFADMYPTDEAANKGYKWTTRVGTDFALAADVNPGVRPPRYDVTAVTSATLPASITKKGNSGNHEQEGQNVLYGDGHVTYQLTPLCGANGDNIYTNRNNRVDQSPVDKDDSLLVPTD
jgi:prepilin-type N-terminal cleavage/methylation domain-containing protein/prepilin-type processing-associated H-X9-DG protein